MKRWGSAVLAVALLAMPMFVTAKPEVSHKTAVSPASCCCCSPDKERSASTACQCDGCAQKNSQNCGCTVTAPLPVALPAESSSEIKLSLSGWIHSTDLRYDGRTDPPLLRPPIFS